MPQKRGKTIQTVQERNLRPKKTHEKPGHGNFP